MMDYESYSTLVEPIYDAALNPELWVTAVENLKDEFNSIAAGFFIQTVDQKLDRYLFEGPSIGSINALSHHTHTIETLFNPLFIPIIPESSPNHGALP